MRKNDPTAINLQIESVVPFNIGGCLGFTISWSSDIGVGEYSIYQEQGKWIGDSEYMDCNEDKAFITELLKLFVEMMEVVR